MLLATERRVYEKDNPDSYDARTVQIYEDGIRAVTRQWDDCWHRWVIVSREVAIREIRKLRAQGVRLNDCHWWRWLPEGLLNSQHYGGPGQLFAHEPSQLRYGRRWLVFCQRGGRDC